MNPLYVGIQTWTLLCLSALSVGLICLRLLPSCVLRPHLCLRQAQTVGQLFPLRSHHVVVLLKGSLQAQQLRRREGRSDAFRFPCKWTVEKETVLGHVRPWGRQNQQPQISETDFKSFHFSCSCNFQCRALTKPRSPVLRAFIYFLWSKANVRNQSLLRRTGSCDHL